MKGRFAVKRMRPRGFPLVLTADPTLTADYASLFDAMAATSQTTLVPSPVLSLLAPSASRRIPCSDVAMPLGLRRVESALYEAGLSPAECCTAPLARLGEVIGPDTRLVAVSTGDPLGLAMNSTTMTRILPGRIWTAAAFRATIRRIRRLTGDRAAIMVGGPGAWQFSPDHPWLRDGTIRLVVNGLCEKNISALVRECLEHAAGPGQIADGKAPVPEKVPGIRGPVTAGCIEITRGCGWGCDFCVLRHTPMRSLPRDRILQDAAVVVDTSRSRSLSLVGEDLLRYGGDGARPAPRALVSLLRDIRNLAPDSLIQADHVNLCSVARLDREELDAVRKSLSLPGQTFVWVNTGIETVNGRLLAELGGRAKMGGVDPDDWSAFAAEQVRRLIDAGFFPLVSFVLGLPGENPGDVKAARDWVQSFARSRLAVFPMFYAPPEADAARSHTSWRPSREHWRLLADCYRLNFRFIPRLIAEHQRLGGAGVPRRVAVQVTGKLQTALWTLLLHSRSSRS